MSSAKFFAIVSLLFLALTSAFAQVPASDHVVVLMLENHSYSQIVGNSSMPYLNSLIANYALATNYDANSHYSIPNYFWITTGKYVTLSDGTSTIFNVDNVTRYLLAAGKTWKAYEESIPSVGYVGPTVEPYERNHDPFSFLSDVVNSSEVNNIVPFTQLATDVTANQLPNYVFITPNSQHDGHSAGLSTTDKWLSSNLPTLLNSPAFQPGGNGILFITFDESVDSDCAPLATCPKLPENGGGGHVATIVIGPNVKSGYRSSTLYQHPNVLRTMLSALGITGGPGTSSTAAQMSDFFTTVSSTACPGTGVNQTVNICAPTNNSTVTGPNVQILATATDSQPVNYLQIYVDGVKKYQVYSSTLNTTLSFSSGKHRLTVQASDGTIFKTTIYFTAQ
ncbi:MAG TPA: alkaline phosphatase family protein [Candidatus Koribacter sp.]|jgi:acid phosphatase